MLTDRTGVVRVNEEIAAGIRYMEIGCADVGAPKGGQFVHLLLPDGGHILRRPLCICDFDRGQNTVGVCYAVVGAGTARLAQMKKGEEIQALFPLGNGFPTEPYERIMLVGGGMGAAVLPAIARACPDKIYDTYLGFARADRVVLADLMKELTAGVTLTTDDGSAGIKGFVTDVAAAHAAAFQPDAIFCCGPEAMFRAAKRAFADTGVPVFVSLEQRMGCGVGACLVCSCKIRRAGREEYLRVCKDGPVFDLSEVVL